MNTFAIVRFERQHSEDDDVIRAGFVQRGETAPDTLGTAAFWAQVVHEIRCSDLPVTGARLLHFEEHADTPRDDRYVMYGLVPSIDDDAIGFATRLQREGYDEGMAGMFQVIAMLSPGAAGLVYPATEADGPSLLTTMAE